MRLNYGHRFVNKGVVKVHPSATVAEGVYIDLTGDVIIEAHAQISPGVKIISHRHRWNHSRGLRRDIQEIVPVNLRIGDDAFIGMDAILLAVEEIGDGAIVGAGAVVTKSVPAYEVWARNPAEKIGERKDEKDRSPDL